MEDEAYVKDFLEKNSNEWVKFEYEGKVKLRCILSGHEIQPNKAAIEKYVNGKAFNKSKKWYSQDFTKYEPHIIQSTKHPKKLYCTITKLEINKIPAVVEHHFNGKKFRRMLQKKIDNDEKKLELEEKRKSKAEQMDHFLELNEIMDNNMDDNDESQDNEKDFNVKDFNIKEDKNKEIVNDGGSRLDDYVDFTSENDNIESSETDNILTKKSLKRKRKIVGSNEENIPAVKKKKLSKETVADDFETVADDYKMNDNIINKETVEPQGNGESQVKKVIIKKDIVGPKPGNNQGKKKKIIKNKSQVKKKVIKNEIIETNKEIVETTEPKVVQKSGPRTNNNNKGKKRNQNRN